MQHSRIVNPSKQEVREWFRELVASHEPPPAPEVIREQLWQHAERERAGRLS